MCLFSVRLQSINSQGEAYNIYGVGSRKYFMLHSYIEDTI